MTAGTLPAWRCVQQRRQPLLHPAAFFLAGVDRCLAIIKEPLQKPRFRALA